MVDRYDVQSHWLLDGTGVPAPVNQFMVHGGVNLQAETSSGECYLVFGHGMPPAIDPALNDPENPIVVPIVPVGQFSFSVGRLRDFHRILGDFLKHQEQIEEQERLGQ